MLEFRGVQLPSCHGVQSAINKKMTGKFFLGRSGSRIARDGVFGRGVVWGGPETEETKCPALGGKGG